MQTQRLTEDAADRIIASRLIIGSPGTYDTVVTNVNKNYRKIHPSGAHQVGIVNFAAMSEYHDLAADTLMAQGDYDEAANQALSLSVFLDSEGNAKFPEHGQAVEITVIEKTTSKGITGLFVKSWCPAPKKEGVRKTAAERKAARMANNTSVDAIAPAVHDKQDQEVPAFMK